MSSFSKGLGLGLGLLLAFIIFCVGSCAVVSVVGYQGLKQLNERLEVENDR